MLEDILQGLRAELLTSGPLDTIPDPVWKRTSALNTWGTNAIEGNTLTWSDVEKLLLQQRGVSNRPVPDILETIHHDAAFRASCSDGRHLFAWRPRRPCTKPCSMESSGTRGSGGG